MNTLNFLDANVWRALVWSRHVHAEKARAWFEEAADQEFFFCRVTQLTVMRLLTTEAVMGPETRTMAQAWELWDRIWADDRISFLPEPANLDAEFRRRSRTRSRSPKVWADAYLLAFAATAGLNLITFDRALKPAGEFVIVL